MCACQVCGQKENAVSQNDNKLKAIIEYYKESKDKINISIELEEIKSVSRVNPWFAASFFRMWEDVLTTDSKYLTTRKRQWMFQTETEADKFLKDLVDELKKKDYDIEGYKTTVNVERLDL